MSNHYDVIVIGAGIIGSSVAFHLGKRKLKVLVLDKEKSFGCGSTGSSSAVLRCRYSFDQASIMAKEGLDSYSNWCDYLGYSNAQAQVVPNGILWLMPEPLEQLEKEVQRFSGLDIPTSVIRSEYFNQFFPSLSDCLSPLDLTGEQEHQCEAGLGYFFEEKGGHGDPVTANGDFIQAAKSLGVEFQFRSQVQNIQIQSGKVSGVKTQSGDVFQAPVLVNAAGPWCNQILEQAGVELKWKLEPTRVQVAVRDLPSDIKTPIFADGSGGIYARPEGHAQILFGSILPEDETEYIANPDQFNMSADPEFKESKLHALMHRFPELEGKGNLSGYSGAYTINRDDMYPVVGETQVSGFYVANGFSGHGFKLAPSVGSMVARQISNQNLTGDTQVDDTFLSPNRRPLQLKVRTVLA